jgi:hypothetical protein
MRYFRGEMKNYYFANGNLMAKISQNFIRRICGMNAKTWV